MDADSSYGGSDTAQDYHSTNENNSSFETSHSGSPHHHKKDKVTTTSVLSTQTPAEEINNQFYHINEVTLPINYNENGYQSDESLSQPREPHYLSTANLNINETLEHHSNLEEMNKQYKSTSQLNSESPTGMRRSNSGIDNMVFEGDLPDQTNVKSTFDSTRPYNGELHPSLVLGTNSANHNEEPMTEAVNLELINLRPVGKDVTGHYENVGNGMTTIPLKRENDTEVGNPYDEYFVPVNEHRKYMRGEKLYVTMDKRGKKSKSKCLCWGICLCIVAAALIIGILAAVGVIGNQEPLKEVSARNFDGTEPEIKKGSLFSSGKVPNIQSTEMPKTQVGVTENQEYSQEAKGRNLDGTEPQVYEGGLFTSAKGFNTEPPTPFTPAPSISTVSNIPPSTEMSMIQVPRALDSEIIIDNIQFTPALADRNSSEFKALATDLRKELLELLFSKDVQQYGPADIKINVREFVPGRTGNVIVNYRTVWIFKNGIHNAKDPINEVTLEKRMSQFLEQNPNGLIGPYHIPKMAVKAERILDLCKIDNNGCEHVCLFDYNISDFVCICAHGKILSKDKKTCEDEHKYYTDSNVDYKNNINDQQDYYSKFEPNFETITTTQSSAFVDSEFNKKLKYNIPSTLDSDIYPQTETTLVPESITFMPSSADQDFAQNTEKYATEPTSDMLGKKTSNTNMDTTVINDTEGNKSSERLTVTTAPFAELTLGTNDEQNGISVSISETLAETTTQLANEHTTDHITGSTLNGPSEYSENSSRKFIGEKQNDSTDSIFIHTTINATGKGAKSGDYETYSMPEITTDPNIFSDDKMHELGLVRVVTPEAEIYTTTDPPLAYGNVDSNRIHKTLKEESETVQTLNSINNEMSTKKSQSMEITTELLSQIRENELHFIPVIVNEDEEINKTESLPVTTYVSTEMPSSYTKSVPVNVSEHYESSNQSPKIYEITTEQIVSEMKKNIENSTENFSEQMNVSEHPEYSPNEYMSPFLPEIENDTFTNTLHSDDHFNDPFISKHVDFHENITEYKTNPPNLENDQMNHTNPLDFQQNDTYLGVLPLEHENNENLPKEQNHTQGIISTLQTEIVDLDNITEVNTEDVTNSENLNINSLTESNLEITTVGMENYNKQPATMLAAKENESFVDESATFSVTEAILGPFETTRIEGEGVTSEVVKEKDAVTALPPEIINNVHSNNYFENNSKILEEETMRLNDKITKELELTTQTPIEITTTQIPLDMITEYPKMTTDSDSNMKGDSSTEDLIASETTTNRFKNNDENQTQAITSDSNYLTENSTVNEEIIKTATEATTNGSKRDNESQTQDITSDSNYLIENSTVNEEIIKTATEATTNGSKRDDENQTEDITSDSNYLIDNSTVNREIIKTPTETTTIGFESNNENQAQDITSDSNYLIENSTVKGETIKTATETTTNGSESNNENQTQDITSDSNYSIENSTVNGEFIKTATETTTNGSKSNNENQTQDITPDSNYLIENSTANGEIIKTATETTTNVSESNNENQTQGITSDSNYLIENTTVNGESIDTATELVNFVTTEESNILTEEITTSASQSLPSTTYSTLLDPIKQYEVKETFADITTTEKLFLSMKPTTNIIAIINNEDNEDLSIIPLEKEIVDNTKLDKKRLANEDQFNQLELLDKNSFNSISNEDHSLTTFPEEFNSKYVGDRSQNENVTSSDFINKTSKEVENEKQKLDKYNKAIFNKTIKQDILVLKDNNENLNTVKQEEKIKSNHFDTVKPVTEDFTLPRFTRCVANQFPCLNGTYIKDGSYCIPGNDRCDSVHDCSDGSDEVNCIEEGCPNNFQCSSGQCLKRYLVCDGIINCNDGSDEVNCDKWTCNSDEISCGPGSRCIPLSWKCDGRSHCSDGSDEHHCHQYACSNDAFHCTEQDTCIPLSWKCDGKSDCANGDDEKSCECTPEQFKCKIGGGCIKVDEVCDGIEQCADKSDEWNCLRLEELRNNSEEATHKNILQVHYKNSTWYPVCMDWNNWNTTYADNICQSMGFAGAMLLESIPKTEGIQVDSYYKLVTPSQTMYGQSILSQLKKTENSSCDQLVSITCEEFVCGGTASIDVSTNQTDVDGNNTLPTQLSSLGLLYDNKHNMYCTATILTPLWAIASYSCMVAGSRTVDTSEWTLSAGNSNFNQIDNSTTQTRQIKQIIPHPQAKFSRFEFINDVVLIQLSQPLILNGNISTVCLASKDTVPEQLCINAGWGVIKPGAQSKQQYIHHISGPPINSEECNSTKHYNGMITKDKMCATYDKENTPCYNDEGAPLMCFSNATNTWELQGIQSHQENCGGNTHPTIYSAINLKLKSWITNTIGKKALIRSL